MKTRQIIIPLLVLAGLSLAVAGNRDRERRGAGDAARPAEVSGTFDRATSVLTVNKLGQTVTNLGQFYPIGYETLPTGRWPLGTDHDQIYRMNFYVGIPNNVVSTRARNAKEWDAMPGYHNPDSGKIAISGNKTTWPRDAQKQPYWPVRTVDGKDSIVSQEDSYAVYRDLTNRRAVSDPSKRLNVVVYQSSYAWSTSKDEDYIFFRFEMYNDTTVARDSLYFALYTDFDAGGIVSDYFDDLWGFDKQRQFFYIYDADGISLDWGVGVKPFYLGIVFLETPMVNGQRLGITDWHYSSDGDSPWGDVVEEDQILYEWMSSNPRLKSDPQWPNLFHGTDIHVDDVSLINAKGERLDAVAASGPYRLEPKQKMTLVAALVAGADYNDISANVDRLRQIYGNGLKLVPPPKPTISGTAFDDRISLTWSNAQELQYADPGTGKTWLRQYRIYRTTDPQRTNWGVPYAIIPVDTAKKTVDPNAYVWVDTAGIRNYFYYSYSVTSFDTDSLESGKAFLPADQRLSENTAELRPVNTPQRSLERIRVVPNPYIISATWERKRLGDPLLGEPVRDLSFTNLPGQCTIKIYTLDGDLVKTIDHANGTGTEFWDIRSSSNQLITTGVYFYHISSPAGDKTGKFAIVR